MTRHYTIRGDWMTAGYIDARGATSIAVMVTSRGAVATYDRARGTADTHDGPLHLDPDGLLVRQGARPGYGFLPAAGELERLAADGVRFPAIDEPAP